MKRCTSLLAIAIATLSYGQYIGPQNLRPFIKVLSQNGYLDSRAPSNPKPTEPAGLPLPGGTEFQESDQGWSERDVQVLSAGAYKLTGSNLKITGGAHIKYRGYDITADEIDGNLESRIFEFRGGVTLIGKDTLIVGESVTVDFRNKTYIASQTRTILGPGHLGGTARGEVYISSRNSYGSENEIRANGATLTTCDLDVPHYRIDSRDTVIRPEKRIIMRDVRVKIGGRTLVRIPYLAIPLDTRRERYSPEVGQTRDEGYYIKTIWGVPLPGTQDLVTYLDYYEKLGVGFGGRYRYAGDTYQGFLRAFSVQGINDSLEVVAGHRQLLGPNLLWIETNFQNKNYLNAPENQILNVRASFTMPQRYATSRITYYESSNESASFKSVNRTLGLQDDRKFGQLTRWSLGVRWVKSHTEFSSGSPVDRERVDVTFRGTHDMRKALAELEYQRSIPVGETANFLSAGDRTPVLAIRSDARRLFGDALWRKLPFSTELSVGEFSNPNQGNRITRTYFDINVNRPEQIESRSSLAVQARFRQGIYSDDTAQYSVLLNTSYRYSFSHNTAFNLRYNLLKPRGFTPLAMDRVGNTDIASADISVSAVRNFVVGVASAYDFRFKENNLATPWQQVAVRAEYRPTPYVLSRMFSTYDPVVEKWSTTRIDVAYEKGDLYLGFGAKYDGIRDVWSNINMFVDGLRVGRFSLAGLVNYNGYTKQFDTRQYSVIYDMHCTEAVLQVLENQVGFRPGRQISLFLRIKAFPFDSRFGTGTRGQPLGTGTGFGY